MEQAHTHTVEETETKERASLTTRQKLILVPTGAATAVTIGWIIGDLVYKHRFDFERPWAVLFLVTLAGWIMALHEVGSEKSRKNQERILAELVEVRAELADVRAEVEGYGDERERAGHALATAIRNGNGSVRQLHPVD